MLEDPTLAPAEALRRAELALYEAKAGGGGTFRFFQPELAQRVVERRELELDLRRALRLQEFTLAFQPLVRLRDRRIRAFEALLRWNTPRRGTVSPAEFIPLAEEIGEIHAIGAWVTRTACMQAAAWPSDVSVAVNVSPVQFERTDVVGMVRDALAASGLAPERLELEITEGVLMRHTGAALAHLWVLHSMGVRIALDDFGTGYSSLSYLNSFPFSKLKIDQSFIRGDESPKARALVKAILALGASLEITTLAEGVETQEQCDALVAAGCEYAQGYLFGKPMPALAADALLESQAPEVQP